MATILPNGKQSFISSAGLPLVGGRLYTYIAGTNTPLATYADAAGTIPNTNPVILDARGEATIFWSGTYKVRLASAADATIWTVDNISTTGLSEFTALLAGPTGADQIGLQVGTVPTTVAARARQAPWVTDFGSLQAACDAVPATGGTFKVPNGYPETPSADILISKPNTLIDCVGGALINLGTHRIKFARAANNSGFLCRSYSGNRYGEVQPAFTDAPGYGVRLLYAGQPVGAGQWHGAIEIGDGTGTVEGVKLDGLCINTTGAGQYAVGVIGRQATYTDWDHLTIRNSGAGGTSGSLSTSVRQGGILLDGTGSGAQYCGYNYMREPRIQGGYFGIQTLGQVNHGGTYGGFINSTATAGPCYGIWRNGTGTGFMALNTEVANWTNNIRLEVNIGDDYYFIRCESDAPGVAYDVIFAGGSARNRVVVIGGSSNTGTIRFDDSPNGRLTTNCAMQDYNMAAGELVLPNEGFVKAISAGDFSPTRMLGMIVTDLYIGSLDRALSSIIFRNLTDTLMSIDTAGVVRLPSTGRLRVNNIQVVGAQQPAPPAAATDLATVIALANALRSGLIASTGHGLFS